MPSWTSTRSLHALAAAAWVSAARGRTPVLYANSAAHGGSTIYVDPYRGEAGRFPQALGQLAAGDEGVMVADLDFRDLRGQAPCLPVPIVRPVAQASLVYRAQVAADAYAAWLAALAPALAGGDHRLDAVRAAIEADAAMLRAAGALPGAAARDLRLRSLRQGADRTQRLEGAARRLREVVLPADVLPHPLVRAALALGAQQAVDDLRLDRARDPHEQVLVPVRDQLRAGAEPARALEDAVWTSGGRAAAAAISAAVRGTAPVAATPAPRVELRPLPSEIAPVALADRAVTVDGQPRTLVFRARASDVFTALAPPRRRSDDRARAPRASAETAAVDRLAALLRAEGATPLAVVGLGLCEASAAAEATVEPAPVDDSPDEPPLPVPLAVIVRTNDGCQLHRLTSPAPQPAGIRVWQPGEEACVAAALTALGLGSPQWIDVTAGERAARTAALRPLIAGARDIIIDLRERRLRELGGGPSPGAAGTRANSPCAHRPT